MTGRSSAAGGLDWLLDQLVERATGVTGAIVLSSDGLLVGKSEGVSAEDGDHLSAVASAFQSLARGTSHRFRGGRVLQTVVEMEQAFLLITNAGSGACVAVLTESGADVGMIAYETNVFVSQVGSALEPASRSGARGTPSNLSAESSRW